MHQNPNKWLAVVGLAALALLAYWFFGDTAPALDEASGGPSELQQDAADATQKSDSEQAVREQPESPQAAVKAEPATPSAEVATLVVRARWKQPDPGETRWLPQKDEQPTPAEAGKTRPASNVLVFLRRNPGKRRGVWPWRNATDDAGIVRFEDLAPGRYRVDARRGGMARPILVTIAAAETKTVDLNIDPAVRVTGVVVDPTGQAVAGAEVVTSGWASTGSVLLAITDKEGRFDVQGFGEHNSIGARAKGFAPSMLQHVGGKRGHTVEVRIALPASGGTLELIVLKSDGEPADGARVRVGLDGRQLNPIRMKNGSMGVRIPLAATCDERGRCAFAGVAAGEIPVAARLEGCSPWEGTTQVTLGQPNQLTIRLPQAATLSGTVRDATGAAVARAFVRAGGHSKLASSTTQTDAKGAYRMIGVPLGDVRVEMQARGARKVAKLQISEGQSLAWNPVIAATSTLTGRLLGPSGVGIKGTIDGRQDETYVRARAKQDGHFELKNVILGQRLRLSVAIENSFFPVPVFDAMPPANGELILRVQAAQMPSVRMTGRLVDPDGKPVANASLSPLRRGYGNSTNYRPKSDGSFDLGPFSPGEYRLLINANGWATVRTPWRELPSREVAKFGDIRLERPGTLHVELKGSAPKRINFGIYDSKGGWITSCNVAGGKGTTTGLASGSYVLQVRGSGLLARRVRFQIATGMPQHVSIDVERGTECRFAVDSADNKARRKQVDFELADERGNVYASAQRIYVRRDDTLYGSYEVRPGRYVATVRSPEFRGKLVIEVPAHSEKQTYRIPVR